MSEWLLHVEPGEAQGAAHQEEERDQPPDPRKASKRPAVGEQGRSHAEGDDVGQAVELAAELAGGPGQARDAAVQHVEHDGPADERGGLREPTVEGLDDGPEAQEQVPDGEQAGQDGGARAGNGGAAGPAAWPLARGIEAKGPSSDPSPHNEPEGAGPRPSGRRPAMVFRSGPPLRASGARSLPSGPSRWSFFFLSVLSSTCSSSLRTTLSLKALRRLRIRGAAREAAGTPRSARRRSVEPAALGHRHLSQA